MINPHNYTVSVRQDEFEGEICFEASVREFPDITEYADSFQEAYELAIDSIETTIEVFTEKNRSIPAVNIPANDYSGRVTLRLPKTLHRSLTMMSDSENVSLNQYLCNVLSYYSGFAMAPKSKHNGWSPIERSVEQTRAPLRVIRTENSIRKEVQCLKIA